MVFMKSMKRKIEALPSQRSVQNVVDDLNSKKKMKVDKNFQRRVVWTSRDRNEFFESVSRGIAVSGIIVADIPTGIEASKEANDDSGVAKYEEHQNKGYKYVSEDGMNRIDAIVKFLKDECFFTGTLYDLEHEKHEIDNKKFSDMPESVKHAFRNSSLIVTVVYHAPYSKLCDIFTNVNAGQPLNAVEKRNALSTPISSYIRDKAEGTFKEMWPRYLSPQKINRMEDIKWLSKALVCVNKKTNDWGLGEAHVDRFYKKGVGKKFLANVSEYDEAELERVCGIMDIVAVATAKQEMFTDSKSLPQKTFWSLLYIAEYIYDHSYNIRDYSKLFKLAYHLDTALERQSKAEQASDTEQFKISHKQLSKEDLEKKLSEEIKDDNYYWRWINRNDDYKLRKQRKETLIEALEGDSDRESCFGEEPLQDLEQAA